MTRYHNFALVGTITGLVLAILVKLGIWFLLAWAVRENFPLTYGQALMLTGGFTWLIDTLQSRNK